MAKKVRLGTGPLHVPDSNSVHEQNDRLIVIIKNPTDSVLEADVVIDTCNLANPFSPVTFPAVITSPETTLASFGTTPIPANSCVRFEVTIPTFIRQVLHVTSTGDYEAKGGRPQAGKLEISVTGGTGAFGLPGLHSYDTNLIVHYGDFVVHDKKVKTT